jgi:hypothetical protein
MRLLGVRGGRVPDGSTEVCTGSGQEGRSPVEPSCALETALQFLDQSAGKGALPGSVGTDEEDESSLRALPPIGDVPLKAHVRPS